MARIDIVCDISHLFVSGKLDYFKNYPINVKWSKTMSIYQISYGNHLRVDFKDNKGYYLCSKEVSTKFPKDVLRNILEQLPK